MEFISGFTALLIAGATLSAKGALSEVAKGAGKDIFETIKERLSSMHGVKSLELLENAEENEAFKSAISSDLSDKDIAEDTRLIELASQLQEIIRSIPQDQLSTYAVNVDIIESGKNVSFNFVEGGVRSKKIDAKGDVSFTNIVKASKGN